MTGRRSWPPRKSINPEVIAAVIATDEEEEDYMSDEIAIQCPNQSGSVATKSSANRLPKQRPIVSYSSESDGEQPPITYPIGKRMRSLCQDGVGRGNKQLQSKRKRPNNSSQGKLVSTSALCLCTLRIEASIILLFPCHVLM